MFSYFPPENHALSDIKNCTTASTFEKEKSLKFELLFGEYFSKSERVDAGVNVRRAVDYYFSSGKIFGFACESFGVDYQRFHHGFVLRACTAAQVGNIISGISPGAEVLVKTLSAVSSMRLKAFIKALQKNSIEPPHIGEDDYRKLNYLLDVKMSTDYLLGEIIAKQNPL